MALRGIFLGVFISPLAWADDMGALREYLDSQTAVTVTVSTDPPVFAHERPDLAVNARDYLSLAPIEVNRGGQRRCIWAAYLWSTIDRGGEESLLAAGDEWILVADDRPILLRPDSRSPREIGVVDPPSRPPARRAQLLLFTMESGTLEYAANADELHVELIHERASELFTLWRGSQAALRAFAAQIECTVSPAQPPAR